MESQENQKYQEMPHAISLDAIFNLLKPEEKVTLSLKKSKDGIDLLAVKSETKSQGYSFPFQKYDRAAVLLWKILNKVKFY